MMTSEAEVATTIIAHEMEQVQRADATGKQPIVFVHGLWLLPSSWDRWAKHFEMAGYTALTPGWPDDPNTVAEANAHPEAGAHRPLVRRPARADPRRSRARLGDRRDRPRSLPRRAAPPNLGAQV